MCLHLGTTKASCMNARGIPPATYHVLHLLSYLVCTPSLAWGYPNPCWGYPITDQGGTPSMDGEGVPIPGQGVSHLQMGVPHPWLGYPQPDLAGVPHPVHTPSPWEETWDQLLGYPPKKDTGPVEVLWMEMGYPSRWCTK